MKIETQLVTPEIARNILDRSPSNFRKLDRNRVHNYAMDMREGKWVFNGETIKLDRGCLIDGQHRLNAIIKSGVPIKCVVVEGETPSEISCDSIDGGMPRTAQQTLANQGYANSKLLTAVSRLVLFYEKGHWARSTIASSVRNTEIVQFVGHNSERLQSALSVARMARSVLSLSLGASIAYLGSKFDPSETSETVWFFDKLGSGINLQSDEAVLHLRNRLLKQSQHSRLSPLMLRGIVTLAWNKFALGESCTSSSIRLTLTGPTPMKPPSELIKVPNN